MLDVKSLSECDRCKGHASSVHLSCLWWQERLLNYLSRQNSLSQLTQKNYANNGVSIFLITSYPSSLSTISVRLTFFVIPKKSKKKVPKVPPDLLKTCKTTTKNLKQSIPGEDGLGHKHRLLLYSICGSYLTSSKVMKYL